MNNVNKSVNKSITIAGILFDWLSFEETSEVTGEMTKSDRLVSVTPSGTVYRFFGKQMEEGYNTFFATANGITVIEIDVSIQSYCRARDLAISAFRKFLAHTRTARTIKKGKNNV